MEQQDQNQSHPAFSAAGKGRNRKGLKALVYILVALILTSITGYGVYMWQQNESKKAQQSLQSQIDSLTAKKNSTSSSVNSDNFSYISKVGGLKLTLAEPYTIIVNVDGNKGGAPGATLKIGKQTSAGVIEDNVYEWIQVEIGHSGSRSLEEVATVTSNQLKEASFYNVKISDATVDNQAAKLITADGVSYDAKRRIYIVKSGEFTYEIASKTQDTSKDNDALKAVLSGTKIEAKNLN